MKTRDLPLGVVHNHKERSYRFSRGTKSSYVYFSYKEYGSQEAAKAAAISYAEDQNKIIGHLPTSPKGRMTKKNKSGKVGVSLAKSKGRPGSDMEYLFWSACWVPKNGSKKNIRFSINKFGDKDAFELASIARDYEISDRSLIYERFAQIYGRSIDDPLL